MLTARAQGLAALLTIISLIGCIQKFDYNCAVGLGLIYLGSKHAFLHNLVSFYFLIGGTICVDIVAMLLTQKVVPLFPRVILTIIEIIIKIAIIIVMILQAKAQKTKLSSNLPPRQ